MEEERVSEVLLGGWVVEVDLVGREVSSVVGWGQYRFKDTAGAEGCRVIVADVKRDRVGDWRRLCTTFHGEVLGQG